MSNSMSTHVHSLSQCRQYSSRPPNLPHVSPPPGVKELNHERYLTTEIYVTYIYHSGVNSYGVMFTGVVLLCVCACVCAGVYMCVGVCVYDVWCVCGVCRCVCVCVCGV